MRPIRIHAHLALEPGREFTLPPAASEHLTRVLRLGAGAALTLFNGDGHDYAARLRDAARGGARVEILARGAPAATESSLALTLVQALARGEKMDWILQKATEVGVAAIVPVVTARTEVRLDADRGERRLEHWRSVVASACEQCGRARLPAVAPPQPLAAWLAAARDPGPLLMLDPAAATRVRALAPMRSACLVVGPEGGFDDSDGLLLRHAGAQGLGLGPRVLRTETAGLAALAMLQSHFGDC